MTRKRICIIAFKPARTTIHVLRQIDYLSDHYDLTLIGHGKADPSWPPLTWHAVPAQTSVDKAVKLAWYALARFIPAVYDAWYWQVKRHRLAYEFAVASGADAIYANDWDSLPVAVAAAERTGARVVLHLHEYAEEGRRFGIWSLLVAPAIRYFVRKYVSRRNAPIAASITVCEPIAERYRRELGLKPVVVRNAPKPVPLHWDEFRAETGHVRLVHHGYAKRGRGLHHLIEAVALTDSRFTLDFMLVEDDRGYVNDLKRLADKLAPGRVYFREPVAPNEIVGRVAEYDIGFCVITPSSYNTLMMLPNKFFEYIQAGLAVCVGPSPAMAEVVNVHGLGLVTQSFEPRGVAEALNNMTPRDLSAMKEAARQARAILNADVEMRKVVAIYRQLFGEPSQATTAGAEGTRNWVV